MVTLRNDFVGLRSKTSLAFFKQRLVTFRDLSISLNH